MFVCLAFICVPEIHVLLNDFPIRVAHISGLEHF